MTRLERNELDWFPLDPDKADYRATEGAYIGGITLLLMPAREDWPDHRTAVVVGLMSCGGKTADEAKANAVKQAARYRGDYMNRGDIDRTVSRKTLLSWKLEE